MTCFSEVFRYSGVDESPNVPRMVVTIGGSNNSFNGRLLRRCPLTRDRYFWASRMLQRTGDLTLARFDTSPRTITRSGLDALSLGLVTLFLRTLIGASVSGGVWQHRHVL